MSISDRQRLALSSSPTVDLLGRSIDRCDPNDPVLIPKLDLNEEPSFGPGWSPLFHQGVPVKPLIRCKCGTWSGIGLHHVHADGRVTASYFDATAEQLTAMGEQGKRFSPGCGWHVFIKLADYDQGEFLPEPF